jgi:hypothetical protein
VESFSLVEYRGRDRAEAGLELSVVVRAEQELAGGQADLDVGLRPAPVAAVMVCEDPGGSR